MFCMVPVVGMECQKHFLAPLKTSPPFPIGLGAHERDTPSPFDGVLPSPNITHPAEHEPLQPFPKPSQDAHLGDEGVFLHHPPLPHLPKELTHGYTPQAHTETNN